MLINEIAQKTGISKKAIYIYESKGLLKVQRRANRYREYTGEDERKLNKIKLLRLAGISIADIKLLFDSVVTINELTDKRKREIEREFGSHSEQLSLCSRIMDSYKNKEYDEYKFSETDFEIAAQVNDGDVISVGIDIGTTTISAAVINITQKQQIEFYTIPNGCEIKSDGVFSEQDPKQITEKVQKLADSVITGFPGVKSIGITGQMHGILYVDENGKAVSPFVTWQDKRGDIKCGGETYCEKIKRLTELPVSTGFGFATHFYNIENNNIPQSAVTFCNIADYAAMRLTNAKMPVIHSSIAASFGLFDIYSNRFETEKINLLGESGVSLPDVTDEFFVCGEYKGIPVSAAIGDNQASFLGSVDDLNGSILINIGTGSQISMVKSDGFSGSDTNEIRPLCKNKYIVCGSALCGGQSFAITEKLFREFVKASGGSDAAVYRTMNALAEKAFLEKRQPLNFRTAFKGSRQQPDLTAEIRSITDKNFTAGQMILGVVYGICRELYDFFDGSEKVSVIASGNAVQKNSVFGLVLKDIFKRPVKISQQSEEAAVGAALFSAVSADILDGTDDFKDFIKYREV